MSAVVVKLPIAVSPRAAPGAEARDDRYHRLLGDEAWFRLPETVRRRFSKHLAEGAQTIYRGEVVAMELSRWGWLLAQAARLVGAPLPYTRDALGPSVVVVTESAALGGQIWSRSYPRDRSGNSDGSRRARFPQVIHSAKRFSGPTGLEEYLGLGLVMRLTLSEETGPLGASQLVFRSAGFAVEIAGRAFVLPAWLTVGRCTVIHRAETDERFSFTLTLDHPWLGRLIHQVAFFQEA